MSKILIDKDEFSKKLYETIEMFNIKDRIEDYDTRRQILIQVNKVLEECNKLK